MLSMCARMAATSAARSSSCWCACACAVTANASVNTRYFIAARIGRRSAGLKDEYANGAFVDASGRPVAPAAEAAIACGVPARRVRPWMLVSAAWIVPAVFATLNELAQRRLGGQPRPSLPELLFAGGDWLLYAFLTPGVFAISRRWPLSRPHVARRVFVHLGMSLLF